MTSSAQARRSAASVRRSAAARVLGIVVVLLGLISAPVGPGVANALEPWDSIPTIRIAAFDRGYELSRDTLQPGPLNVAFTVHGSKVHAMQVARLDPGRTQAEFEALLRGFLDGTILEAPAWLHTDAPFGFGPTSPGRSATATVLVSETGRYVLFDLLVDSEGRPFAEFGLVDSFVVEGPARAGSMPAADAVITATETAFVVPRLTSGLLALQLANQASVEHQFAILKLRPGCNLDQLRTWLIDGQVGPSPGEFVANVLPVAPGTSQLLTVRIAPGTYLLVDNGEDEQGITYSELGFQTELVAHRPAMYHAWPSRGAGT